MKIPYLFSAVLIAMRFTPSFSAPASTHTGAELVEREVQGTGGYSTSNYTTTAGSNPVNGTNGQGNGQGNHGQGNGQGNGYGNGGGNGGGASTSHVSGGLPKGGSKSRVSFGSGSSTSLQELVDEVFATIKGAFSS